MWRKVEPELPKELREVTTSVWDFNGAILVGVMRQFFLRPPVLWAQPGTYKISELKLAKESLNDLQLLIKAPIVYAEVDVAETKSQRFLTFLDFTELGESAQRKFYQRSL